MLGRKEKKKEEIYFHSCVLWSLTFFFPHCFIQHFHLDLFFLAVQTRIIDVNLNIKPTAERGKIRWKLFMIMAGMCSVEAGPMEEHLIILQAGQMKRL